MHIGVPDRRTENNTPNEFRQPFQCGDRERRRSEEHTSELQSQSNLVCRLLLEKKKKRTDCERLSPRRAVPVSRVPGTHVRVRCYRRPSTPDIPRCPAATPLHYTWRLQCDLYSM